MESNDPLVPFAKAAFIIGDETRPIDPDAIRQCAKRLNAIEVDENGRQAIRLSLAELFRTHWRLSRYLKPRGVKTVAEFLEATR